LKRKIKISVFDFIKIPFIMLLLIPVICIEETIRFIIKSYRIVFATGFLLVALSALSFAIMPTIRGFIDFDTKSVRDVYYTVASSYTSYCVSEKVLTKNDVEFATSTYHYTLNFYFNMDTSNRRNIMENAVKVLSNSHIIKAYIEVWDSNNDGVPGLCQPDVFLRSYSK